MTNEEFNDFSKRLFIAFPSILDWLRNKSPDMLATQAVWRKTLAGYTLAECDAVLERWVEGDLPPPNAYERDVTAVFIRQVIERDRSQKRTVSLAKKQEYEDGLKFSGASPIGPIMASLIALAKRGVSMFQVRKELNQLLPSEAAYNQPRYRCAMCLDRGLVEVWRNDLARNVDQRKIKLEDAYGSYNVACVCSAGDHYATANKYWHAVPRYSPDQFCRWKNESLEEEQARLQSWLAERVESMKHQEFLAYAN